MVSISVESVERVSITKERKRNYKQDKNPGSGDVENFLIICKSYIRKNRDLQPQ